MNSELEQELTDAISSLAREVRRLRACVLELADSKPTPSRTCWKCEWDSHYAKCTREAPCPGCLKLISEAKEAEAIRAFHRGEIICWSCEVSYSMIHSFCPNCRRFRKDRKFDAAFGKGAVPQ